MSSRVVVVGAGRWGLNIVRNLHALGALHGVCELDPARREELRARYPDVPIHESIEPALADPGAVAVAIATPAPTHHAIARVALRAGKDVFVEKPLALAVEEASELIDLARAGGRVLMVGHLLRYHPAVHRLKGLIGEGTLGKLYFVYSNRLNLGQFRTEENILWSFAPHDISVMLYLLDEMPVEVSATGSACLTSGVPDLTLTDLRFASGVRGHVFVSWLNPYKEQRLVVVGELGMAVFDDAAATDKLVLYDRAVTWRERHPVPNASPGRPVDFPSEEPLRAELRHFLECVATRRTPNTDGEEGLRVLRVLAASQRSLDANGALMALEVPISRPYFVHPTAVVDAPSTIGEGTRIWHFSHVLRDSRIGRRCSLGQNVMVGPSATIGDEVKIQNNVSVYEGVTLEDHVFCGPSMVFTNVHNPRSEIRRMDELRRTLVRQGATLGANCTIVCGTTIGRYAFVGAGAVVTRDVPDYALMVGNPARRVGWMCRCGIKLGFGADGSGACDSCGAAYELAGEEVRPQ